MGPTNRPPELCWPSIPGVLVNAVPGLRSGDDTSLSEILTLASLPKSVYEWPSEVAELLRTAAAAAAAGPKEGEVEAFWEPAAPAPVA